MYRRQRWLREPMPYERACGRSCLHSAIVTVKNASALALALAVLVQRWRSRTRMPVLVLQPAVLLQLCVPLLPPSMLRVALEYRQ